MGKWNCPEACFGVLRPRTAAFVACSAASVDWASVMHKPTLPLLLLMLVVGQISAGLCQARCEGMRMPTQPCGMHGMVQGHCAACNHASVNGANGILAAPEACFGEICNGVFGLVQNRPDAGVKPLSAGASGDLPVAAVMDGARPASIHATRPTGPIPPFDPLISSIRI